jgi:hypothetical protein
MWVVVLAIGCTISLVVLCVTKSNAYEFFFGTKSKLYKHNLGNFEGDKFSGAVCDEGL